LVKPKQSAVREQILDTASRLFFDQGYNLTGINQIIAEAGVAKASLYLHFPSKEDLCVEYLQRRHSRWFDNMENYLEGIPDAKDKIIHTFIFRGNTIRQGGFRGCSFLKIISEVPQSSPKIRAQVIRQKVHLREFFTRLVSAVPGVPKEKVNELADQVMLMSEGATVMCQAFKDEWPMEAARKSVSELLKQY